MLCHAKRSPLRGTEFAWQPCCHIQNIPDVGQWFCVPPFRMVYLFQGLIFGGNFIYSNIQYRQ